MQSEAPNALGRPTLAQRVIAEMVGTFALVFAGCGAIMVAELSPNLVGHGAVAAVFGLVITVMIAATGHISGAHFNPAVSIAFAAVGRFSWREVPAYVVGQFAAALIASALLAAMLGDIGSLGMTRPTALEGGAAIGLEAILTFFLMFVIAAVATDHRAVGAPAGVAIGGTVAIAALFGGPLTGGSMNPARSLGPAWVHGELASQWIYVVGPVAGAALGAWVYERIRGD